MRQPRFVETTETATDAGPLAYTAISRSVTSWIRQRSWRLNMLLVGAPAAVEAALSALVSDAPGAVSVWPLDGPMPTRDRSDVVIVRDVDRMPLVLQDAWVTWLNGGHDRPQIIATSSVPVFPLVAEGCFRSELYYRLNTVLLDLAADETV